MKTKNIIDCDAAPFVPDDCSVVDHRKGGLLELDFGKITLYLSDRQKEGLVSGSRLMQELMDKLTLNANVLDYLLAHQKLIPEEWKGKNIFFWGTIYCDYDGDQYVRFLYWNGSNWDCFNWRCGQRLVSKGAFFSKDCVAIIGS